MDIDAHLTSNSDHKSNKRSSTSRYINWPW